MQSQSQPGGAGFEGQCRRMLILGTGFVGRHLAHHLLQRRWHVSGTCSSSPELKQQLRSLHDVSLDAPHLFQFDAQRMPFSHQLQSSLQLATHVLVSIPPISASGLGDPLLALHKDDLHHFLTPANGNGNLQWLAYLSSTSVYGDCGGASVDEDYPINPLTQSESAKLRYQAETAWVEFGRSLGLPTFIFRLGGIYGPGRSALDTLFKGRNLSKNQKRRDSRDFYRTARIHVTDICQAILSSIHNPSMGKVYNVVDDDPAPRAEVFAFAKDLITRKYPEMASDLNHASFGHGQTIVGEKLVSNMRMKKELGVQLMYPSYKSGLQSILDSWHYVRFKHPDQELIPVEQSLCDTKQGYMQFGGLWPLGVSIFAGCNCNQGFQLSVSDLNGNYCSRKQGQTCTINANTRLQG